MRQVRLLQRSVCVCLALVVMSACEQSAVADRNDAAELALERSLAATCASCHGMTGESVDPNVPSLMGLSEDFIVSRMRSLRGGADEGTVMNHLAGGYTDDEVQLIAAYFARISSAGSGGGQ